ncbi:ABC transporter substrate-binding protein [Dechloromonas sp. ARDL1]|uniref:ABC transporter substrate-binding protein n=1 Tax=Dechloromonas sp. ARDL1 TaxID=3322121 RepID=UPI003DA7613F
MRHFQAAGVRAALVALAVLFSSGAALADFKVVQIAPLSGPLADTGKLLRQGAELAFREANERGGVHGQKVVLESLDDGYKVEETVRLARELAKHPDKPVALLGLVGTGNMAALLKQGVVDEVGVPIVGVRTGAVNLRQPGHPLVFHLRASYESEMDKLVEMASAIGSRQFGVFYQDDPFGHDGLESARKALGKRKLTLVASGGYAKNTTQVEAAVDTLIKAAGVQAIVMASNTQATAAFVQAYRARGGVAQLYAMSVNNDREIVERIGAQRARGLGIVQVVPFPFSGVMPLAREYQKAQSKQHPGVPPTVTGIEGYIYGKVLLEALRRAGPQATREALVKALEGAPFELGGYVIDFSPQNHEGSQFVELTIIGAGGKLMR